MLEIQGKGAYIFTPCLTKN